MRLYVWITDLWISGFQSHENTHIQFDKGFNIIIGPSDSGKSAIMRTMEFILFNKLRDSNFMTKGMDSFEGAIRLSNGKKITRKRNKKENIYELEAPGEEIVILSSFGNTPVSEVLNFHGIKPMNIGGDAVYLSFQSQHDAPFFLTDKPGDKAALIGSIAKTDIIDVAISDLGTDILRSSKLIKACETELQANEDSIIGYGDLPQMKQDVLLADKLEKEIKTAELNCGEVKTISHKVESLSKHLIKQQRVIKNKAEILIASSSVEKIEDMRSRNKATIKAANNVSLLAEKLTDCEATLARISKSDLLKAKKLCDEIILDVDMMNSTRPIPGTIKSLISKSLSCKRYIDSASNINLANQTLEDAISMSEDLAAVIQSFEKLKTATARIIKGNTVIEGLIKKLEAAQDALACEIESSPICPICGKDMRI